MSAIPVVWQDCIAYALAHEVAWPRDPEADPARWGVHHEDPPPWNTLRGPVHARGGVSGVVWQRGQEVLAWGEPERADLTFSVAKTYLAVLAGVAHGAGLLPDVDEPVMKRVRGTGFESEHNCAISWAQLLEQTSEWEGACFGVPDTVDRYRKVSHDPRPPLGKKGDARPLQTPGTHWEYNDVRINQLALALLHLFGKPLPEVFRDAVMRPLGAKENWRWVGYHDGWVTLDGRRMPSVPGGSHWGGGVSIGARDQARIAQMLLDGGRHHGQQIVPRQWVERMHRPGALAPFYGWLIWLNGDGQTFPGASRRASFMVGAGGHYIWMEPEHQAVIVVRWLDSDHANGFMERATRCLEQAGGAARASSV